MNFFLTKQVLFFISFLLYSFQTTGQEIPKIDEKDIPGFSITRNQTFDGSSLWGYMNGGADIYMEYGFEILRVQEFSKDEEILKMELYKMSDPVSAFGIYSIKSFKCAESGILTGIDCLNAYQFQLVYGDYYISITNESGSEKAKPLMLEIAQKIRPLLKSKDLQLPCTWLTDSLGRSPYDIKMIMGPLGLQNKAPELVGLFDGINAYRVFFAGVEKGGNRSKFYEIVFMPTETGESYVPMLAEKDFRLISKTNNKLLLEKQ